MELRFISHEEDSRRSLSIAVSHARRTQATRRTRLQRESAKQEAGYARSLVGWRTADPRRVRNYSSREIVFQTNPDRSTQARFEHETGTDVYEREDIIATIQSAVDSGVRCDPFNAFPSDNSRAAMHAVDFYVTIWSIYKRGAVEELLGLNTQIDLCWPIALQDDMLFDATLSVSRVAYCLGTSRTVQDDAFFLNHKLSALSKLRSRVAGEDTELAVPSEAMVLAVSRLLSIAYMTLDDQAFQMHFRALQKISRKYLVNNTANERMTKVVAGRMKSWTHLFQYRWQHTGFGQGALQPGKDVPQVTRLPQTLDGTLYRSIRQLPFGFAQLAIEGAFSTQTTKVLIRVHEVQAELEAASPETSDTVNEHHLYEIKQDLINLIASPELGSFEQQVCYALLALVMAWPRMYQIGPSDVCSMTAGVPAIVENPPLERMIKAFLYLKFGGKLQSPLHNLCLQWCALTIGSCCFQVPDFGGAIRRKGHIALISITERLIRPSLGDAWEPFERDLSKRFFWPSIMVTSWKSIYLKALDQQKDWEGAGLMALGMPSSDKIDYMVLTLGEFFHNLLCAIADRNVQRCKRRFTSHCLSIERCSV